jgi:hypothetical protein
LLCRPGIHPGLGLNPRATTVATDGKPPGDKSPGYQSAPHEWGFDTRNEIISVPMFYIGIGVPMFFIGISGEKSTSCKKR